ncbi:MAG TPA: DNA replication protein DnaC [Anaerolinea thermolimosa]|uniref:DNA replication protein DnaC n=2 Tax=Anaerolinea thermolimosa TaxID=229919 RepID=A0A3D1JGM3_9CHLR|nr:replicative DNA helicase loader DnaI [Anaerolinea thermolimosa]HCE17375.1 DNA replication protein DnaC [Anaerolinea thermolimosa]
MSKESSPTSSNTEAAASKSLPGDPNCPICRGVGFVRRDVPIDHPDFGKVEICSCRAQEVARMAYQRVYRLSNLTAFSGMTFETFKVQGRVGLGDEQVRSLKYAFDQAQTFARTLSGWLLLTGAYGVGKTHLAAAIANFAVSMGVPTLFLTVPDLLDWLRYAYGALDEDFETRFEEIRNIALLVMDDLGTQNATPWAQEKLYQIFNHRYVNRLPTVVTTNQPLEEIEGRIQSRLRDPELVTMVKINAQDYRQPLVDTTQPRLSALPLYSRMTFGSFNMREREKLSPEERANLEKAFQLAQTFAENPRGWLVFSGTYGCGKTHLAAAIGNYQASRGQPPIFVVVPDLLDHLRSTFSPNSTVSYDEVFEEVRSARLLILDDLGTQNASPWAREKLYQIFNHRYTAELPTVITTASRLDELDPRIRSRMLDTRLCTFFGILAPAYVAPAQAKKTPRARKTD